MNSGTCSCITSTSAIMVGVIQVHIEQHYDQQGIIIGLPTTIIARSAYIGFFRTAFIYKFWVSIIYDFRVPIGLSFAYEVFRSPQDTRPPFFQPIASQDVLSFASLPTSPDVVPLEASRGKGRARTIDFAFPCVGLWSKKFLPIIDCFHPKVLYRKAAPIRCPYRVTNDWGRCGGTSNRV